jgi:tryptophanyl-tRNA synthetase
MKVYVIQDSNQFTIFIVELHGVTLQRGTVDDQRRQDIQDNVADFAVGYTSEPFTIVFDDELAEHNLRQYKAGRIQKNGTEGNLSKRELEEVLAVDLPDFIAP